MSSKADNSIPVTAKLGYGIGNMAYSLPHQILAASFIFYATAILRIPASLAGAIMAVAAIWDGLSDPLMGYISDNTGNRRLGRQRLGRRHPYLLIGTAGMSLLTLAIWSIDAQSSFFTNFWTILVLVLLLKTALTIYVIPYNALGGEMATGYDERSSIQAYRATFYLAGMLLALVGSNLYFFRPTPEYPKGQLNPAAYSQMGIVFALIILFVGLTSFFFTKKLIPGLPQKSFSNQNSSSDFQLFWKNITSAFSNRNLRILVIMIFLIEAGLHVNIVINIHVSTYLYNLGGPMIGLQAFITFFFSIISQPLWVKMTRRFGKKRSLQTAMLLGFGLILSPWTHVWWEWFRIDSPQQLMFSLGFFNLLGGTANGAFMSIPFSMIADAVDEQEVKTGKRDEGVFFGLYTFAWKAGTSISLALTGLILSFVKFNPDLPQQSSFTNFQMAMIPSYILLLFAPIAILILRNYSITREKHQEFRSILEDRKNEENGRN